MFSLIVCSVHPPYLLQLQASVAETIGVAHEWLTWDNRKENRGLATVYNDLAAQAQHPYIIFLHEDLIFNTQGWGQILLTHFEQHPGTALIGVAGGRYKSNLCSGWYTGLPGYDYIYVTHRDKGQEYHLHRPDVWPQAFMPAAVLDGLFMACRKKAWEASPFDTQLLKGFHFYDIDFSLRLAQQSGVMITNTINLIHLTKGGDYSEVWAQEALKYHHARKNILPFAVGEYNRAKADKAVALYWLDWLKNFSIKPATRWRWVRAQGFLQQPGLWYAVAKFLLYKPLRLKAVHEQIKNRRTVWNRKSR